MNYCWQCLSTEEEPMPCPKCHGRYCGGHVTPGKHNGCWPDENTRMKRPQDDEHMVKIR